MSTAFGFGANIYETVAIYDTYVEYRITNSSLNVANYEPIYAVRGRTINGWEPMDIAPEPRLLYAIMPVTSGTNTIVPNPSGPSRETDNNSVIGGNEIVPGTEIPEPAYHLAVPLLMIMMFLALSRKVFRRTS